MHSKESFVKLWSFEIGIGTVASIIPSDFIKYPVSEKKFLCAVCPYLSKPGP